MKSLFLLTHVVMDIQVHRTIPFLLLGTWICMVSIQNLLLIVYNIHLWNGIPFQFRMILKFL